VELKAGIVLVMETQHWTLARKRLTKISCLVLWQVTLDQSARAHTNERHQLTLPPSFGSAYVGEPFSCTLCANNELEADSERRISNIKVDAEMQTVSETIPLDLTSTDEGSVDRQRGFGESLQRIVRFDLREVGSHTLAVNVNYFESTISSGRVRNFRKLYQFVARPCLNVRTKVSPFSSENADETRSFALEAQMSNMADGPVTLRTVTFNPKSAFKATSLNWDTMQLEGQDNKTPILSPRDITQIAFLIEQQGEDLKPELTKDGKVILGQLSISWRTAMGDTGFLSTGWITTKR